MCRNCSRDTRLVAALTLGASILIGAGCARTAPAEPPANNTVYEVFVRSFCDSNGDGVGDLRGLTQKLDYLNDGDPASDDDLEVGILWLMPIFPTTTYHGYDVTDYETINPDYGDLSDFDKLIREAHRRGLRVILDVPLNHTSNQHPWFLKATRDQDAQYAQWYHLTENQPDGNDWHWTTTSGGRRVYYFGDFGCNMPDLNMDHREVKEEVKRLAKFWLDRGADGFRLDAAKHVFSWSDGLSWEEIQKNNAWWREFSDHARSVDPSAVIVGEVLDSEQMIHHFAWSLNGLLDLHFMHRVRSLAATRQGGIVGWWSSYLKHARENNADFNLFPYASSHDENPRLASLLRKEAPGCSEQAYRLGMYVLLTIGKYPVLYYGDEIMQKGWKWDGSPAPGGDGSNVYDETLREPFPWYASGSGAGQTSWFTPRFDRPDDGISVEEQQGPESMRSLVRALTNFRAEHPDFADGEIGRILNDGDGWIVFEKTGNQETYLVLINALERGLDYGFHDRWFPEYERAPLLFWADGRSRTWKDTSSDPKAIEESRVFVAPAGLVILRRPQ